MKDVADASVLVLRANKARATGYVQLVQMAQPELYLTLQVRVLTNTHALVGIYESRVGARMREDAFCGA